MIRVTVELWPGGATVLYNTNDNGIVWLEEKEFFEDSDTQSKRMLAWVKEKI